MELVDRPVLAGPVGILIQEPHNLMRDCLRTIVNRLEGITVVAEVASPREAIDTALKLHPEMMLVDLAGAEEARALLAEVHEKLPGLRLIWLADEPGDVAVKAALENGDAGLVLKRDSTEYLAHALDSARRGTVTVAAEFANPILRHYADIVRQKRSRDAAIIETLASAVDAKDSTTGTHAQRVPEVAAALARHIDPALEGNEPMRYGFVLHDVGKIGIPDSILLKEGALDREEWRIMKTHPILGLGLVGPLRLGDEAESVIRNHHERWDGSGYPDRLAGEEIPLGARIFAVADTFDAMTNDRPYRKAMTKRAAFKEIRKCAGKQFDPKVVDSFLEMAVGKKVAQVA